MSYTLFIDNGRDTMYTEINTVMIDWLAKMFVPREYQAEFRSEMVEFVTKEKNKESQKAFMAGVRGG
jgi:hypothetical protein